MSPRLFSVNQLSDSISACWSGAGRNQAKEEIDFSSGSVEEGAVEKGKREREGGGGRETALSTFYIRLNKRFTGGIT